MSSRSLVRGLPGRSSIHCGCRPPPLEEARPQGSIARHGVNTETLVLDVPLLRVIDEDPPFDHDPFLALLEPWAEQKSRERREARMRRRKRKKRRKKKLPKAASGHGRPCDHATPVPAVFAAREREGASDSVHGQTLELPAAPQRQVRTVLTWQVFGDSTLQFLGEVVDGTVGVQHQEIVLKLWRLRRRSSVCLSGSWTRLFTCPLLCNDMCLWWSRQSVQFSYKDADVPVFSTTRARGGPDSAVLAVQCGARGDSTGAVLGQVVHARRCCVCCRLPDSAENPWSFHRCSFWTRFTCPLLCLLPMARQRRKLWRFHRCCSWTRCTRPCYWSGADGQTAKKTRGNSTGAVPGQVWHARRCGVWCPWPTVQKTCGDSTGAVLGQGLSCPSLWRSRCAGNCVVPQLPRAGCGPVSGSWTPGVPPLVH